MVRAGAVTDPEPGTTDDATKALQVIGKAVLSKDEAAGYEKGKLTSIGKVEERPACLMRGCDALTVSVCPSTVGKELFHALKKAGTQGRPLSPVPRQHRQQGDSLLRVYVV